MVRKFYILLIALFASFAFQSCDLHRDITVEDVLPGKWFVNSVNNAGYSMRAGYDPIVVDYFINFFYGDYMTFLKGDMLDFSHSSMIRSGFNGRTERFGYKAWRGVLELRDNYRASTYSILTWNEREMVICFDKGSLLEYITMDMNSANSSDYAKLAYIYDQVNRYVQDFYIEYVVTRYEPSASEIIVGNYYGNLADAYGPLFNNGWVSTSLYFENHNSFKFVLNDEINLSNGPQQGPPFNVEVPLTAVQFGVAAGQLVFEGRSYMNHYVYGRIDMYIVGRSYNSQTLETDITIQNNGLEYNLYFRNGIRYLLTPAYYRTKSQPQEKKVIELKPTGQS